MMGGFSQPEQPGPSEETKDVYTGKASADIIKGDPTKYLTQNLPGVTYDAAGNITGSSTWTPRSGAATTQVAGNYIGYTPSQQVTAPLPNFQPVQQPNPVLNYNTAPQQYNFAPRYAAQGGMMETQGAFPGNPLTMQSNPVMAMGAHQLPMNTSGVPMNLPMGFAGGGIAAVVHALNGRNSDLSPLMEQAPPPAEPWSPSKGMSLAELVSAMQNSSSANQKEANARLAAYYARQRAAGQPVANERAGIASLAVGGYPRRTGQISGPGTETSDDIPAMLSDGEFVMTAKAVKGMGGGSRRAGAKKMYALMHRLEKNAARG